MRLEDFSKFFNLVDKLLAWFHKDPPPIFWPHFITICIVRIKFALAVLTLELEPESVPEPLHRNEQFFGVMVVGLQPELRTDLGRAQHQTECFRTCDQC